MVTCGSVLASSAEPPAGHENKSSRLWCEMLLLQQNRQRDSSGTESSMEEAVHCLKRGILCGGFKGQLSHITHSKNCAQTNGNFVILYILIVRSQLRKIAIMAADLSLNECPELPHVRI